MPLPENARNMSLGEEMANPQGAQVQQKKGWSKGCMCCTACGVITVVVLAIAIPVGIFVVGPNIAQSILDKTEISLTNLTQAACPADPGTNTTPPSYHTRLWNHVNIKVPNSLPIAVASTLKAYKQEIWTTACVDQSTGNFVAAADPKCGDKAQEWMMGYYESPEMTVSPGDNKKSFIVTMTSTLNQSSNLIVNAWVQPLWLNVAFTGMKQGTRLILKAKVDVQVMGITFKGLTQQNEMTCRSSYNGNLMEIPTTNLDPSICYPSGSQNTTTMGVQAFPAICEVGKETLVAENTTTTPAPVTTASQSWIVSKLASILV